jgi:uncharacterized membrane protein YoaK (UPF0700 family)
MINTAKKILFNIAIVALLLGVVFGSIINQKGDPLGLPVVVICMLLMLVILTSRRLDKGD